MPRGRGPPGPYQAADCAAFGRRCTPRTPAGATMVSSEGACAAYHRYRRLEAPGARRSEPAPGPTPPTPGPGPARLPLRDCPNGRDGPRRRRALSADWSSTSSCRPSAPPRPTPAWATRRWSRPAGARLAFTTDSFVVRPMFFPAATIGDLAVNGTVNDLAMAGPSRWCCRPPSSSRRGPPWTSSAGSPGPWGGRPGGRRQSGHRRHQGGRPGVRRPGVHHHRRDRRPRRRGRPPPGAVPPGDVVIVSGGWASTAWPSQLPGGVRVRHLGGQRHRPAPRAGGRHARHRSRRPRPPGPDTGRPGRHAQRDRRGRRRRDRAGRAAHPGAGRGGRRLRAPRPRPAAGGQRGQAGGHGPRRSTPTGSSRPCTATRRGAGRRWSAPAWRATPGRWWPGPPSGAPAW